MVFAEVIGATVFEAVLGALVFAVSCVVFAEVIGAMVFEATLGVLVFAVFVVLAVCTFGPGWCMILIVFTGFLAKSFKKSGWKTFFPASKCIENRYTVGDSMPRTRRANI